MPRRSKKHCHAFSKDATPDLLLVGSGNPSYRDQAHATAHPTCPCHCLVTLATRSPGRGAPCSPQEKNATVMLRARHCRRGAYSRILSSISRVLAQITAPPSYLFRHLDALHASSHKFGALGEAEVLLEQMLEAISFQRIRRMSSSTTSLAKACGDCRPDRRWISGVSGASYA